MWMSWLATRPKPKPVTAETIRVYLHGLSTLHLELAMGNPSQDYPRLYRLWKGIKKREGGNGVTKRPRLPITTHMLNQFNIHVDLSNNDQRLIWAALTLATYGLLRVGEFATYSSDGSHVKDRNRILTLSSITFHLVDGEILKAWDLAKWSPDRTQLSHMAVSLAASKTDPFRTGVSIMISHPTPIAAMITYITNGSDLHEHNRPLFMYSDGSIFTRHMCIELTKLLASRLGHDPAQYSGHSYRKGGATSLANAHVPDSVIKVMGRWESFSFALYVSTPPHIIQEAGKRM